MTGKGTIVAFVDCWEDVGVCVAVVIDGLNVGGEEVGESELGAVLEWDFW